MHQKIFESYQIYNQKHNKYFFTVKHIFDDLFVAALVLKDNHEFYLPHFEFRIQLRA